MSEGERRWRASSPELLRDHDERAQQARFELTRMINSTNGKRVQVSQMTIERFRDGKIVEHHRLTDELELRRQLGAL